MINGQYIGGRHDLRGQSALLRFVENNMVAAQFDNIKLHKKLSHGWTEFQKSDFRIEYEYPFAPSWKLRKDRLINVDRYKPGERAEELLIRLAATKAALTNGRFLG